MKITNNFIELQGTILSEVLFSHETLGEKFYSFDISSERTSGTVDVLPVIVSERLITIAEFFTGRRLAVKGQVRTRNETVDGKRKLLLAVFVTEINELQENDINNVDLNGYICKPAVSRVTPSGREIADLLLAVNRKYGKSDYIPCICWGRNASYVSSLDVGTGVTLYGRLQSREYEKDGHIKTAYEMCAAQMSLWEVS